MSLLLTHDVCFVGGVSEEWVHARITSWQIALARCEVIVETDTEPGLDEDLFHYLIQVEHSGQSSESTYSPLCSSR